LPRRQGIEKFLKTQAYYDICKKHGFESWNNLGYLWTFYGCSVFLGSDDQSWVYGYFAHGFLGSELGSWVKKDQAGRQQRLS